MTKLLKSISFFGLALTIVPSLLVFTQTIPFDLHTHLMLAGMFMWFLTAPFWMKDRML